MREILQVLLGFGLYVLFTSVVGHRLRVLRSACPPVPRSSERSSDGPYPVTGLPATLPSRIPALLI